MMEKRTNAVKSSFAEAENKNNEALKLKQEYEQSLQNAEVKAESIIKEAKQRALEEHDKQIQVAKEEVAKMIEDAKKSIELERKLSMQQIQSEIAGIAMVAATKVIQKNINDNTNNKIINDFLAEAGAGK
jgi:F-type H+-transporting ATPase subunit b